MHSEISDVVPDLQSYFHYVDNLSQTVKISIYDYTTDRGYDVELNEKLINKVELSGFYKEMYNNIMFAFDNSPHLLHTLTLYKGSDNFMNTDFNLNYFCSTSYSVDEALKFTEERGYLYVITCTPGSYGVLPIEKISESPSELEILLPPRGKFSIQNIVKREDSIYNVDTIYITYIPISSVIIDTQREIIPENSFVRMLKYFFL
jgi:hypothetical protein